MSSNAVIARVKQIYYGWIIVFGFAVIGMVATAMLGINFGLFIDPIVRETGISQTFFGWAQTAQAAGVAVSSFLIGRMLDRFGARWPLVVAAILEGAVVVAMAMISGGWQMIGIFVLMGVIGLRAQGGSLYALVTVSNWFVRDRGKAMARVFLGTPIGIFIAAPLTTFLIDKIGWRAALVGLGVVGGAVILLIALFIKRSPEEMGLAPDGDGSVKKQDGAQREAKRENGRVTSAVAEYSWTRAEALRSLTFWKLTFAFGLLIFAMSTLGVFRMPFFVSKGISAQVVAYSLSLEAVVSFGVAFAVSWGVARVQPNYLLMVSATAMVGAFLVTIYTGVAWQVFVANSLFGVSAASQMVLTSIIWPNYFGARNIGAIRGISLPFTMAFSFAGPPIAGWVKDIYGSYIPSWWMAIGFLGLAAVLFLLTPKPPVREAKTG